MKQRFLEVERSVLVAITILNLCAIGLIVCCIGLCLAQPPVWAAILGISITILGLGVIGGVDYKVFK